MSRMLRRALARIALNVRLFWFVYLYR